MEEGQITWILLFVLIVLYTYKRFLVFTRDVPEEYLNEQSIIDSTRNPNESAIHKSTKLDYSQGLRVGLGIRYDHYKLRNGNLYDVWELAVAHAKIDPSKAVYFGQTPVKLSLLNGQAAQIRKKLFKLADGGKTIEVRVSSELVFTDPETFAVILACFTSQIRVHIHDGNCEKEGGDSILNLLKLNGALIVYQGSQSLFDVSEDLRGVSDSLHFANEYTYEKDRGIGLCVSYKANHMAQTRVEFAQSNLVSAVASCIKHLPPRHRLTPADKLAVIYDTSSIERLVNGLVKTLVAFVAGAELHLDSDLQACASHKPSIISATTEVVDTMNSRPAGLDIVLRYHRLISLSCNRFSGLIARKPYPQLRLVIAHRQIDSKTCSPDWRQLSATLASHIIEENGHFNAAGPILVTDFYDYRSFSKAAAATARTHGAVAQSNEIKLVEFDGQASGKIAARGYNFGKAKTIMKNVGEDFIKPDADGFYQISTSARWGSDGCLYVVDG